MKKPRTAQLFNDKLNTYDTLLKFVAQNLFVLKEKINFMFVCAAVTGSYEFPMLDNRRGVQINQRYTSMKEP
jgi:hypothetical protein